VADAGGDDADEDLAWPRLSKLDLLYRLRLAERAENGCSGLRGGLLTGT
jgi:hypothetical protein